VRHFGIGSVQFLFREIFVRNEYAFQASSERPVVFDCGANIGMATLFFKWLYPDCEIHAFEPDPETFGVLSENVSRNKLRDVSLHNVALVATAGRLDLFVPAGPSGSPLMSTLSGRGFEIHLSAAAGEIRCVVGPHHAAVVAKAVRQQEIDGGTAQIPGRRAVALRLLTRQAHDSLVGACQIGLFLITAHTGIGNVRPAVVADLVAIGEDGFAFSRVAFDGEPWHEPGAADPHAVEEVQDPMRGQRAEFAARQGRGRGHAPCDKPRLRVEVVAEADDVARHARAPGR